MEHPKRSLMKTVSWRLLSFMATVGIIYGYTKDLKNSLTFGAGIDIIKMFFYYLHERLWNRVKFGKMKKEGDYQI